MNGKPALLAVLLASGCLLGTPWVHAAPPDSDAAAGRLDYILHCQGCHQPNGAASPDGDVPRMQGFVGHFLRVPEGRTYLVQVPGVANAPISSQALARLLNWMLTEIGGPSTPKDFTRFTSEEVHRHRQAAPPDLPATRHRLLQTLALPTPTHLY